MNDPIVQRIPGIRSVAYILCELLPRDITLRALAGEQIFLPVAPTPMAILDTPECTVTRSSDDAGHADSVSLKFRSSDSLPRSARIAFIISDIKGQNFIIGSAEPQFPKINVTDFYGSLDAAPAAFSFEISHSAVRSPAICFY